MGVERTSDADARAPWSPRLRVAAFIPVDDRILLVAQRRSAEQERPPYWLLPGGGVSLGESLHDALARELAEELGVSARLGSPIALVESISPDPHYPKHVVHVIIAAALKGGVPTEPRPLRPAERTILDVKLFGADELDALPLRPPVAAFLRRRLLSRSSTFEYLGRVW